MELQALLHTTSIQDALARPIVLQVLVAAITYLWVNSVTQAIARADRATTIAALERTMAQQGQREAQQKRELEVSIQQIVQVHAQVAKGDFSARVPPGLQLMVVLSGRERYEAQFRRLFEAAGLHLSKIWPTKSLYSIVEGVIG